MTHTVLSTLFVVYTEHVIMEQKPEFSRSIKLSLSFLTVDNGQLLILMFYIPVLECTAEKAMEE